MNEKSRVMSIRVTEEQWRYLREYEFYNEITKASLVRELIQQYIEKEKANAQKKQA